MRKSGGTAVTDLLGLHLTAGQQKDKFRLRRFPGIARSSMVKVV
jgi:hypothetical protein